MAASCLELERAQGYRRWRLSVTFSTLDDDRCHGYEQPRAGGGCMLSVIDVRGCIGPRSRR